MSTRQPSPHFREDLPASTRQVRLARRPVGAPQATDFEIVEVPIPELVPGEMLIRNTWMSVDPSMRIRMHADAPKYMPAFQLGTVLDGFCVGEVLASRADGFAAGQTVLHSQGWREHAVATTELSGGWRGPNVVPIDGIRTSQAYLGPLGSAGVTAYFGLTDAAALRPGDVVFVSGAAGGVGSLVVQIAHALGNRVIASAGTPQKVDKVLSLGADAAFCYRDGPVLEQLQDLAPAGIDVYFDNVGRDHLQAALEVINPGGRVAMCGAVSSYNSDEPVPGPSNLFNVTAKGLNMRGFLARTYAERADEFRERMAAWMAAGDITTEYTVFDGLDRAPEAFAAMLSGANVGKTMVRLC